MLLPKKLRPVSDIEILEEVSKELNLKKEDVDRTYDIWLEFLDYIANETDQATVYFPHLGRMYVSTQKLQRGLYTEKLKELKERKLREIDKFNKNCKYSIHKHCVPIILKYGISKKNSIPYILGETDTSTFYTINEIVNNQTDIFFKEDLDFSENKKLKKEFYRENNENN